MRIPRHWAESSRTHRHRGRRLVVRRFGWSDTSPADASAMADARVQEACAALDRAGRAGVPLREPKVPYNGAEGVPIREVIVETHGEAVVTRNAYGARCLNVPDVVFVDVDFANHVPKPLAIPIVVAAAILGGLGARALGASWSGAALTFAASALLLGELGLWLVGAPLSRALDAPMRLLVRTVRRWATRDGGRVVVYRTPAGARLVWLHRRAPVDDPGVVHFFRAVGVDPAYATMCTRQRCYRARLTAKPWRAGFRETIVPRPGTHPIHPSRVAERDAWVARYEAHVEGFAACERVTELGDGPVDPVAAEVVAVHDRLARVGRGLPIA